MGFRGGKPMGGGGVYTDGSATKDQSGWGITVKQSATAIHEDSAALYGLNLQLDNGGGSSHQCPPLDCLKKWQSGHTCHHPHILSHWSCYKNWNGKPKTGMCQWTTSTFREKGNDRADRLAGKAALTSGLFLGRSEMLRSLRHYLRSQNKGHHTINRQRREAWKEEAADDLPWKDERGPLSIMMNWCLMSSDVMRHIKDKLWPMPKHGAVNLYVHGNEKAR